MLGNSSQCRISVEFLDAHRTFLQELANRRSEILVGKQSVRCASKLNMKLIGQPVAEN